MPIYNTKLLGINQKEVIRYAGVKKEELIDEKILSEVCEEAKLLIKIRGIWKIYNYDYEKQEILIKSPLRIEGKSIGNHLRNCDKVICLAATVGEEITNEVTRRFEKGDYFFSLLLDAAATTVVEQVADEMEKQISQLVTKEGYNMKWRFSPGYGDWSLAQQESIFKLSGAEEVGIQLSESLMLMPRKSITAIIGLTKKMISKTNQTKRTRCESCAKINCISRNCEGE